MVHSTHFPGLFVMWQRAVRPPHLRPPSTTFPSSSSITNSSACCERPLRNGALDRRPLAPRRAHRGAELVPRECGTGIVVRRAAAVPDNCGTDAGHMEQQRRLSDGGTNGTLRSARDRLLAARAHRESQSLVATRCTGTCEPAARRFPRFVTKLADRLTRCAHEVPFVPFVEALTHEAQWTSVDHRPRSGT